MMLVERLLNRLGCPFGINHFSHGFPDAIVDHSGSPAAVFGEIHRANFWDSRESLRGLVSELAFIETYCRGLVGCLVNHGNRSLFGVPCCDLNWVSAFLTKQIVAYAGGHDFARYVCLWSRNQIGQAIEMAQVP